MRIVIIEDDEGIIFSLRIALEDRGHDIVTYIDPTQVPFDTLEADVILLDYYMPKMDGEMVLKRLRQNPKLSCTKIILMSASMELVARAQELAVQHLAKPFDLEQLYATIEVQQ